MESGPESSSGTPSEIRSVARIEVGKEVFDAFAVEFRDGNKAGVLRGKVAVIVMPAAHKHNVVQRLTELNRGLIVQVFDAVAQRRRVGVAARKLKINVAC